MLWTLARYVLSLTSHRFQIEEAAAAYDLLGSSESSLGIYFDASTADLNSEPFLCPQIPLLISVLFTRATTAGGYWRELRQPDLAQPSRRLAPDSYSRRVWRYWPGARRT